MPLYLQGTASLLLTTLEKEKELLRIFLKVSQMENSMLRRMNLSSFLMVRPKSNFTGACALKPFTREVLLKGRLSTDELPALTSLDQLIFT
jgi:hypothetical protein